MSEDVWSERTISYGLADERGRSHNLDILSGHGLRPISQYPPLTAIAWEEELPYNSSDGGRFFVAELWDGDTAIGSKVLLAESMKDYWPVIRRAALVECLARCKFEIHVSPMEITLPEQFVLKEKQ